MFIPTLFYSPELWQFESFNVHDGTLLDDPASDGVVLRGVALTDHGTMTTTMMTTAADEDANIAAGLSALSALLVLPVAMLRC
eukprot:5756764-Amphidinium_carterae.1